MLLSPLPLLMPLLQPASLKVTTLVHGSSILSVVHIPNLELILDSLLSLTPYIQPLRNSEFQFQNKLII